MDNKATFACRSLHASTIQLRKRYQKGDAQNVPTLNSRLPLFRV
jgi:hypothetical protein